MVNIAIHVNGIMQEDPKDSQRFYRNLKGMLDYIYSKKHIFQVLLNKNGDANMQANMIMFAVE